MELKEIRIFHNSQDYEFKTREALAYYIKNHFQTTERNLKQNETENQP